MADGFIPYRRVGVRPTRVWPAASRLRSTTSQRLPVLSIVVGTDGRAAAIERARTVARARLPGRPGGRRTCPASSSRTSPTRSRGWQQLANVVILASLPIAGCSLAVSVVGGLTDRKRPFSLLRLTGAPVRVLRRVVALESAVPLLVVAVVAIGDGPPRRPAVPQGADGLHADRAGRGRTTRSWSSGWPPALGIIASTLPLLGRITGPETARSE